MRKCIASGTMMLLRGALVLWASDAASLTVARCQQVLFLLQKILAIIRDMSELQRTPRSFKSGWPLFRLTWLCIEQAPAQQLQQRSGVKRNHAAIKTDREYT